MPPKNNYHEPSVRITSTWTPPQARQALIMLEGGYYYSATSLATAIMADDRAQAVTNTRINGVLGLPLVFEAADDSPRSIAIRDALAEDFWKIFPDRGAYNLLFFGQFLGAGIAAVNWSRKGKRWLPQLDVWSSGHLREDKEERQWLVRVGDGSKELAIDSGDGKWVLYTPFGKKSSFIGAKVRALAIPYLMKAYANSDWGRYSEIHGTPIRVGKARPSSQEGDDKKFLQDLRDLGSDTAIVLRDGDSLELVEATANSWQTFDKMKDSADKAMAIAMLGQNLTTDVQSGSLAAAKVHDEVRQDLIEADAKSFIEMFASQILPWWLRYNFGANAKAPTVKFDTEPPEDESKDAKTLNTKMDALTKAINIASQNGLNIDTKEMANRLGIPLLKKGRVKSQSSNTMSLASGRDLPKTIAGQKYIDGLTQKANQQAAKIIQKDLSNIKALVQKAKNPQELKTLLLQHYQGMDSGALTELNSRVFMMANLAGHLSASE